MPETMDKQLLIQRVKRIIEKTNTVTMSSHRARALELLVKVNELSGGEDIRVGIVYDPNSS